MANFPFTLSAQLIITVLEDQILLVAEDNYVVVNFNDHAALERVMQNVLPPSSGGHKGGLLAQLEKAKKLSSTLYKAGLIIDVRVNQKTYVQIGASTSPKVTANAV